MDHTVHGILQSRILEWVAFPFSRDHPNPGIERRSLSWQADSWPAEPQTQLENGLAQRLWALYCQGSLLKVLLPLAGGWHLCGHCVPRILSDYNPLVQGRVGWVGVQVCSLRAFSRQRTGWWNQMMRLLTVPELGRGKSWWMRDQDWLGVEDRTWE